MKQISVLVLRPFSILLFLPSICFPLEKSKLGTTALKLHAESPARYQTCQLFDERALHHTVRRGDILYFSYGVKPGLWQTRDGQYEFVIAAEVEGKEIELFRHRLDPKSTKADRGWQNAQISLESHADSNLKIEFHKKALAQKNMLGLRANGSLVWGGVRIGDFRRRPKDHNVIIVSLDTLRADHLGIGGYRKRKTSPNIDRIARAGVYFQDAVAESPWTKPSHMSLFTSLYPSFHRMIIRDDGNFYPRKVELDDQIPTLTEELQKNGYLTHALTGSAYLSAEYGFYRGFDRYVEVGKKLNRDGPFVFGRALQWIKSQKDQKFFLFLHTYEIHSPFSHKTFLPGLKDPTAVEKLTALYDGGVLYADQLVGDLKKGLEDLKIDDKTILIIVSDHGEELLQRGYAAEHEHTLYDELLRIPIIFYCPSLLAPRLIKGHQAQLVDIMPTVLDLTFATPKVHRMQGETLVPFFTGTGEVPNYAISESVNLGPERKSIRYVGPDGEYKLIIAPDFIATDPPLPELPTAIFKDLGKDRPWVKHVQQLKGWEFYDLVRDPTETTLSASKKSIELQAKLFRYIFSIPRKPLDIEIGKIVQNEETAPAISKDLKEKLRSLGY